MNRFSGEQSAVLSLLRWALDYVSAYDIEAGLKEPLDWSRVVALAGQQGVACLLHDAVARSDPAFVPTRARTELSRLWAENAASMLLQEAALRRILPRFASAGVPCAVHKGFGLGALVYDRPELRPAGSDCDILVRRPDFAAARTALEDLGYTLMARHYHEREVDLIGEVKFVREMAGCELVVDLHVDFAANPWGKVSGFRAPDFWGTLDKLQYAGMEIPHLPATAYLLYLCLHCSTNHYFDRLILFCDIDFFIRKKGDAVDWARLVDHARSGRARKATFLALHYCRQLLGTRVPREVLEELRPGTAFWRLVPARSLLMRSKKRLLMEKYMHVILLDHPADAARSAAVYIKRKVYRLLGKVSGFHLR